LLKNATEALVKLKYIIPTLILSSLAMLSIPQSQAKPAYSTKEKKSCTFCHVKQGSKELNDAGNYYKEHNHSLEGFKPKS
jgi:hypothetical protein